MTGALLAGVLLGAPFFTVQLHAVSDEVAALESVAAVRERGFDGYYLLEAGADGQPRFKVRAGRFVDREAARAAGETLRRRMQIPEFFVTQTDDAEVLALAGAVEPLVEDRALTSGFLREGARSKRVRAHLLNYLTAYLLASGEPPPGSHLLTAAVWDTNVEDHREMMAVTSAVGGRSRGYVLYWTADHYEVAQVVEGSEVKLHEIWDLSEGPLRTIVFDVHQGGKLFEREDYVLVRWNPDQLRYREVGRVPTVRIDHGENGFPPHEYRAEIALEDVDGDQEQEILAREKGTPVPSLRLYDWNGTSMVRLVDPKVLMEDWVPHKRVTRSQAAEVLLGIARGYLIQDRPVAAESAWRILMVQLADTPQAGAAKTALEDMQARRERADLRQAAGADLLEAGNVEGAVAELGKALEEYPYHGPALYTLGCAHAKGKNPYAAIVSLRRAFQVDAKYRAQAVRDSCFATLRPRKEFQSLLATGGRLESP